MPLLHYCNWSIVAYLKSKKDFKMKKIFMLLAMSVALFAGSDDFEDGGFQEYNGGEYTGEYDPQYNEPDQFPEPTAPDFSGEGDTPAPEDYSL